MDGTDHHDLIGQPLHLPDNLGVGKKRKKPGQGPRGTSLGDEDGDDPNSPCRNQTGYIGVRMRKWGMYAAEIRDGDKRRWLGSFATGREAGLAYDAAAVAQKGNKAKTNFRYKDYDTNSRPNAEEADSIRWDLLPEEIYKIHQANGSVPPNAVSGQGATKEPKPPRQAQDAPPAGPARSSAAAAAAAPSSSAATAGTKPNAAAHAKNAPAPHAPPPKQPPSKAGVKSKPAASANGGAAAAQGLGGSIDLGPHALTGGAPGAQGGVSPQAGAAGGRLTLASVAGLPVLHGLGPGAAAAGALPLHAAAAGAAPGGYDDYDAAAHYEEQLAASKHHPAAPSAAAYRQAAAAGMPMARGMHPSAAAAGYDLYAQYPGLQGMEYEDEYGYGYAWPGQMATYPEDYEYAQYAQYRAYPAHYLEQQQAAYEEAYHHQQAHKLAKKSAGAVAGAAAGKGADPYEFALDPYYLAGAKGGAMGRHGLPVYDYGVGGAAGYPPGAYTLPVAAAYGGSAMAMLLPGGPKGQGYSLGGAAAAGGSGAAGGRAAQSRMRGGSAAEEALHGSAGGNGGPHDPDSAPGSSSKNAGAGGTPGGSKSGGGAYVDLAHGLMGGGDLHLPGGPHDALPMFQQRSSRLGNGGFGGAGSEGGAAGQSGGKRTSPHGAAAAAAGFSSPGSGGRGLSSGSAGRGGGYGLGGGRRGGPEDDPRGLPEGAGYDQQGYPLDLMAGAYLPHAAAVYPGNQYMLAAGQSHHHHQHHKPLSLHDQRGRGGPGGSSGGGGAAHHELGGAGNDEDEEGKPADLQMYYQKFQELTDAINKIASNNPNGANHSFEDVIDKLQFFTQMPPGQEGGSSGGDVPAGPEGQRGSDRPAAASSRAAREQQAGGAGK